MTTTYAHRRAYDIDISRVALPLEQFRRNDDTLTAESSQFGRAAAFPRWLTTLFNDACDMGIGIRSHKTGRIVRFVWNQDVGRNDDYTGGYDSWHFTVLDRDNDQPIKQVVIFND